MRLRELRLERSPGLPDAFAVAFAPEVTLVLGPNGAGKTSICRAVQRLLWKDIRPPTPFAAAALWESDGSRWRVARDGADVPVWQRDGAPSGPPPLPGEQVAARYRLSLLELLQRDPDRSDTAIAQLILTRMAGGYDLEGLLNDPEAGFQLRRSHGRREEQALRDAEGAVAAIEGRYRELAAQEDRLAELAAELRRAQREAEERTFWETAAQLADARDLEARAETALDRYPPVLEQMVGDEGTRLEELTEQLARTARQRDEREAELAEAQRRLQASALPEQTLEPASLNVARDQAEKLRTREEQLERTRVELGAAEARIAETARLLAGGPDPATAAPAAPGVVARAVKQLAAEAEADAAIRAVTKLLNDPALQSDATIAAGSTAGGGAEPEARVRAAALLREWLAAPDPAALRRWRAAALLFALALGGVGVAAALTGGPVWGWIVAALGGAGATATLIASLRRPVADLATRGAIERRFRALAMPEPRLWSAGGVAERVAELDARIDDDRRQTVLDRLRAWLAAERDTWRDERESRRATRAGLVREFGAMPPGELADLAEFADRIRAYHEACAERAATAARVEELTAQGDELRACLTTYLSQWGYAEPSDAATARRWLDDLHDRERMRDQARRDAATCRQAIARFDHERERLTFALDELYRRCGVEPDDQSGLMRLLDDFPEYQKARRTLRAAQTEREVRERDLQRAPGVRERPDAAGLPRAELAERLDRSRAAEAHSRELQLEIDRIERDLQRSRREHELEAARARVEACRTDLAASCRDARHRDLARLLIEEVRAVHDTVSQPRLLERARTLLKLFTHGAYELVAALEDGGARFRAVDTRNDRGLALDELSDGTRTQLLLAARLAYLEDAEAGPSLPLFLDEVLTNSDPARFDAVATSLARLAHTGGRQIVYLTCDPVDVQRWQNVLASEGLPAAPVRDLARLRGVAAAADVHELIPPSAEPAPSATGRSAAEYGRLLQVARFDPAAPVGGVPLFYLLRDDATDLRLLERLLNAGVDRVGSWRSLAGIFVQTRVVTERERARLDARIEVLEAFTEAWREGRGRRVDRAALETSGAVSDVFLSRVDALAETLGGEADRLVAALATGEVKGFRHEKTAELRDYLEREGYLDARPILAPDARLARCLRRAAGAIEAGVVDESEVVRLVRGLQPAAGAGRAGSAVVDSG
jgi:DNA repair exonuclease SbcCD ATPase subunit